MPAPKTMIRHGLCASTLIIFLSSILLSADWPAFRGKDGNGKSPDTGLLEKWDHGGPKLLWAIDTIGMGYSSVSIADGKIYVNGNIGNLSMVFCLDKTGKEIWRQDNGVAHLGAYPGTRGTPTIDGTNDEQRVYDMTPLGEIACFHAKTGKKIWHRNISRDYNVTPPQWFFGHSVVVDGDHVICSLGGKQSAVALNKRTGETVWTAEPVNRPSSYTTPYFFEFEEIRVVAVLSDSTIEGLDPKTGKTIFSMPWNNSRNVHCTMPIYHNGHLFMTTGYEGGAAKLFKLTKNADSTLELKEVWSEPRFNNQHGGVVLAGDHVYGTSHNGSWCSINFMTGELSYPPSRHAGKGSVHYADGLLYGLTEDNKTVLLMKPEPKQFVLLSSFELPHDAEGKSWAHPVVLDGRLYLRHAQYLYCYDVKSL